MSSAIWGAAVVVRIGRVAKRSDKDGVRRRADARARSHSANFGSPRIICASWRADTCPLRMHSSKSVYSTSISLLAMAYTIHRQPLKDVRRSNALDNPSRWLCGLGSPSSSRHRVPRLQGHRPSGPTGWLASKDLLALRGPRGWIKAMGRWVRSSQIASNWRRDSWPTV